MTTKVLCQRDCLALRAFFDSAEVVTKPVWSACFLPTILNQRSLFWLDTVNNCCLQVTVLITMTLIVSTPSAYKFSLFCNAGYFVNELYNCSIHHTHNLRQLSLSNSLTAMCKLLVQWHFCPKCRVVDDRQRHLPETYKCAAKESFDRSFRRVPPRLFDYCPVSRRYEFKYSPGQECHDCWVATLTITRGLDMPCHQPQHQQQQQQQRATRTGRQTNLALTRSQGPFYGVPLTPELQNAVPASHAGRASGSPTAAAPLEEDPLYHVVGEYVQRFLSDGLRFRMPSWYRP